MIRVATPIALLVAFITLHAATAGAQTNKMAHRAADERIEPIFDLPDAPPYRRAGRDLDLGYRYPVRPDGTVTVDAYRAGSYVLFFDDRYLPVSDQTLTLIAQNIGEDPLAAHYVRRDQGQPAPIEPEGATPSASAKPLSWAGGAEATAPARGQPVTIGSDASAEADEAPSPADGSLFQLDNRALGAATALILLLVAGFRLAGVMRTVRGREGRGETSAAAGAGTSRRRLPISDVEGLI
ncbi:hypothetical protein [Sphingomonas sp.]|uniref:hypothetical protein n=1 Tax=Sphingomonas sp. TaxID=28214 RepID=UPI002DD6A235|nr:hypothetical protein [Sphingomonas sp.]